MADEVKAPEVTEAPEKSIREAIEDSLESTDEVAVAPDKEATGEVSEAEEIAAAINPGEEGTAKDELSDVERAIKEVTEAEETPNVQKRIDKLTAEKKALEERLARIEASQEPKDGKLPKYSDEQLKAALKKGIEDGDTGLVWDIMDHMRKQTKQDLIDMYEAEKNAHFENQKRIDAEWKDVQDAYARYADTKVPEIWPNSHKDLDLKNGTSMLYQIAMALYWNKDQAKADYYQKQPGGQKLAVADALTYLIRTKAGSRTETKVKKLEKQLTKERMKKSPVSGVPGGEQKPPKAPLTDKESLEDYINERKNYQDERGF
jgi:hypothetical protein